MLCSYCGKPHKILLLIHEDVQNSGPTRKEACFACLQDLAEKIMRPPQAVSAIPPVDWDKMVKKEGATFSCCKCGQVLVRIEPNGLLGETLNPLDTAVICDHYMAKHDVHLR